MRFTKYFIASMLVSFQVFGSQEAINVIDSPVDAFPESALLTKWELYSETTIQPGEKSAVTQTRLRFFFTPPQWQSFQISPYLGLGIDRELSKPNTQWIQNSYRPLAGLMWQPTEHLQAWAEYNRRFYQEDNSSSTQLEQDDPRLGVAYSTLFAAKNLSAPNQTQLLEFSTEAYAEGVSYLRIKNEPVISGHLRPVLLWSATSDFKLGPYSELYFQRSPEMNLGLNIDQARAGMKIQYSRQMGSLSLYAYWPKEITKSSSNDGQPTGLLVLGGVF